MGIDDFVLNSLEEFLREDHRNTPRRRRSRFHDGVDGLNFPVPKGFREALVGFVAVFFRFGGVEVSK